MKPEKEGGVEKTLTSPRRPEKEGGVEETLTIPRQAATQVRVEETLTGARQAATQVGVEETLTSARQVEKQVEIEEINTSFHQTSNRRQSCESSGWPFQWWRRQPRKSPGQRWSSSGSWRQTGTMCPKSTVTGAMNSQENSNAGRTPAASTSPELRETILEETAGWRTRWKPSRPKSEEPLARHVKMPNGGPGHAAMSLRWTDASGRLQPQSGRGSWRRCGSRKGPGGEETLRLE